MKYFVLTIRKPQKGQSGESCGSRYDLNNACQRCGTGAQLVGKLLTKGLKNINEHLVHTYDGDVLISNEVYTAFAARGILADTVSACDHMGNAIKYYHLTPFYSFPKMLPESKGLKIEEQCHVCKRNGYFNDVIVGDVEKNIESFIVPIVFHYRIDKKLLEQADIFRTWEHMGISNIKQEGNKVIRYARPLIIISEKVKAIFETLRLKKVYFDEVIIKFENTEQ